MQNIPLAERIRPRKLSEVIGQEHLIGVKGALKSAIVNNNKNLVTLYKENIIFARAY